jgi:hypothetical protein
LVRVDTPRFGFEHALQLITWRNEYFGALASRRRAVTPMLL